MSMLDFDEVVEHYQRALEEFVKGNPEPNKMLFSHQEDVTLANPSALPCVDGSRLLRLWSVPPRRSARARSLLSRT
jgi:hypothetical protein